MNIIYIVLINLSFVLFYVTNTNAGLAKIGEPAPKFTLESLDGKKISLSDYKGKVVILDFFALWCKPCKDEIPLIQKAYNDAKKDSLNVEFLLLCIDGKNKKAKIKEFLDNLSVNITTLIDAGKTYQIDYGLKAMPTLIIINKNGIIVDILRGEQPEIDRVLKGKIENAIKD